MLTSAADIENLPDLNSVTKDPRIPKPCGYKILVMVPKAQEKTKGGLYLPDNEQTLSQQSTPIVYIVALGPEAYQDHRKFPSGPSCKPGDWAICRPYSGSKFNITADDGVKYEFRLINDDSVEATVEDPREIRRA